MAARNRRKKQPDGSFKGFVFSTLSFLVICAALVLGMSVFFRVSSIEVVGADRYTQEEIVAASGVEEGDNLIFLNREAVAGRVYAKLIYIGEVKVSRKLPSTVVIDVSESGSLAVVETDAGLWLVDRNCRLLESCKAQDIEGYIKVMGFVAVKPQAGESLSTAEEDKSKAAFLRGILTALAAQGITADVDTINLSNPLGAEFGYLDGRFTVRLGADEKLDYKIALLTEVVQQLNGQDTGVIDLTQDKKAQFSPF